MMGEIFDKEEAMGNKCDCGNDAGSAYICTPCAQRLAKEEAKKEAEARRRQEAKKKK
jgi:hypothetical protein